MRRKPNYALWLCAAAISAYFLWCASQAIGAHFAQDDPMNIGIYWARGFWRSSLDDLCFWSTAIRPLGGMFYLPIYHLFGLNPIPYRIVVFALIAVNTFLGYRIADLLTGSKTAAVLTALLVCAHGNMGAIYFNTSQIYDVMAYLFLAIMLLCYMRVRQQGRDLKIAEAALVICAYAAALDAKEMAVVGAGWVLAYELLYHQPWKFNVPAIRVLLRQRALRVPLILVVMSVIYAAGKSYGASALATQPGYAQEITWHRFFYNNRWYLDDLFYTRFFVTSRRLVVFWVLLSVVCFISRKRSLLWAWFVVSTATLPVSFAVRPRGGPGLYIPLLGWAILISAGSVLLFQPFEFKWSLWRGGAMVVARRVELQWAACALVALFAVAHTLRYWSFIKPAAIADHQMTWSAITQIRDLPSRPSPHSRVIFLENPFAEWDVYFVAELVWNDPTIEITLANKTMPSPSAAELAKFDWVLTFDGRRPTAKLRVLRSQ